MSKKYPQLNDKAWLYQKYWKEELSGQQIADVVRCTRYSVYRALKRFNIPRRTLSEAQKGKKGHFLGKHHSRTTKRKLSETNKGKRRSEESKKKMIAHHADMHGKNNPMHGKHHTKDTKRKIAEIHKGKKFTQEHKQKIREALIGEKCYLYGKHRSDATKQKIREARKKQILPQHHTKIENIYEEISKKNNIPSEYTGDSKIWIGRVNPDFIIRDERIAIFINGDYWHSGLLRYNIRYTQRPEKQIKECKRHKWKAVIIWGTDLLREDAEQFVLSTLKKEGIIM